MQASRSCQTTTRLKYGIYDRLDAKTCIAGTCVKHLTQVRFLYVHTPAGLISGFLDLESSAMVFNQNGITFHPSGMKESLEKLKLLESL